VDWSRQGHHREHKAQLWIGHDKDITAKINRAPKFYE
jgi:hypothetical protein